MRSLLLSAALLAGVFAPAAFADPVTFNLINGTIADGTTVSGNVQIDPLTGTILSGDFTFNGVENLEVTLLEDQQPFDGGTQYFADFADAAGDDYTLDIPGASLVGYTGGNLCTYSAPCDAYAGGLYTAANQNNIIFQTAGALAPTPEPSSLVLLGTGVLGLAGAARRRFFKA